MNSTCLFLMEVWSDRGSTCKFRFSKFTRGSSVASYLHEKHTSRIQSLYLYFIKIVPFWLRNIRVFFNTKHPVIILRASLFVVTSSHVASLKIECQIFSYVYRSRKHWKCKYFSIKKFCKFSGFNRCWEVLLIPSTVCYLNKANTSNIVLNSSSGYEIKNNRYHHSYEQSAERDGFGFLFLISPDWVVMFLDPNFVRYLQIPARTLC